MRPISVVSAAPTMAIDFGFIAGILIGIHSSRIPGESRDPFL
jgi:hypothetical protein